MKGVAPIVIIGIVVAALLLGAAVYLASGSSGTGSPSIKEIVAKNLGYMCEWNGRVESFVSFDVWGKYYFHGKKLRFEEKGAGGITVYVDPDITDPNGTVYQWSILSRNGNPVLPVSFSKSERSPESFEEILRIVYTRQDEPFLSVLKETLEKAKSTASSSGIASMKITKVECHPWTPDDTLFQPPQTS